MSRLTIQQTYDLALQHHRAGRLQDAEQLYRQILTEQPEHAAATHNLAVIARQIGRSDVAVNMLRRAIALKPNFAEAHTNLGNALMDTGQFGEAIAAYRQAIALNPNLPEGHNNLGNALRQTGQLEEAIAAFRRAIALNVNYADAHNNLGIALNDAGKWNEAVISCRRAIAIKPDYAEAWSNLGNALKDGGKLDEAIAAYRQAILLNPGLPESHNNLGIALKDKDQLDDAITAWRQAIALRPNFANAHSNLGIALRDQGRFDEAIAAWRKAISLNPRCVDAHFGLAQALLLRGDWEEGWIEHEWRWQVKGAQRPRPFAQPCWTGQDLTGKTILLYADQGLGDTIQFVRYVPLLARLGANVVLEVQAGLKKIAKRVQGATGVVERGHPLPPFDFYCPMFSLPLAFKTTLPSIPSEIPYLSVDAQLVDSRQEKLAGFAVGPKVALSWAGNPGHHNERNRSMNLSQLALLGTVSGVQFFSLQKGEAGQQAANPPPGIQIIDWTDELRDFSDTAALVAQMDLVISVDTAVAHLAAAMGKPVWLLLPFVPDWRWLLNRDDSPWYPTMRLFRQKHRGDWQSVIAEVAGALKDMVSADMIRSA